MNLDMDSIQFESRKEIDEVIAALEEWQKAHAKDTKSDTIQELIDHLEAMYMSW